MFVTTHDDLLLRAADLDHVQRRSSGDAKSLSLTDREVMNAGVLADDFTTCSHEFASCIRQRLTLLGEIGIDEALIVSAGDEADLLRVGLLGKRQTVLARKFAHLRLLHVSQRKESSAQLILGEAKKEVRLVLAQVGWALEQPTSSRLIEGDASIMASRDPLRTNLLRHNKKLVKLQVIVA